MIALFFLVAVVALLLAHRYRRANSSLLPWPTSTPSARGRANLLQARWETSALNAFHDVLVSAFSRKGAAYTLARVFYGVGTFVAALGVLASVAGLLYEAYDVARVAFWSSPPTSAHGLAKRVPLDSSVTTGNSMVLKPLIPGLTTPLADLPLLLIALLLAQSFHELGHLVASALPPAAATLSRVGLALPGAFWALA
ncbi:hypothetical protein EXIGLDRAFT_763846 [Exidia glandulosa HHB12029]|uniref:Endopeptidase S2P n=1 Tax=Exidia glandulosa HHB12029 TaxID=1314781 RepID=A0A165LKH8_EXIGL|nr:hypothetical protein EXIGLDRAFT_763846 [Exidia glandulosa HHB12029]